MLQGARHNSVVHSSRWASQTPSQQLRHKHWTPPDLSRRPEPEAIMSRYTAPQYVIGNTSYGMLRRIAHRLHNGPSSGKDRKVVGEVNLLEEEIRLGISMGELGTGQEHQVHEMEDTELGNDHIYPRYELGYSTPKRHASPISNLPDPPHSQTDDDMTQYDRLADYLQAQSDEMRRVEVSEPATTSPSQSPKAMTPRPKAIGSPVSSLSTFTGILDSSSPLASQKSQGSNAASLPYPVAVDSSSARSCSTISIRSSQRPCLNDDIYSHADMSSHDDIYSASPSYSILDYYTSEEEPLISIRATPQSAISQRRSSPKLPTLDAFADTRAKYPDHPAFRLAPPVPPKDVPQNIEPISQSSKSESFSKIQDMDGKGRGMENELRPGMDEPEEYKKGPRIRHTEGNFF